MWRWRWRWRRSGDGDNRHSVVMGHVFDLFALRSSFELSFLLLLVGLRLVLCSDSGRSNTILLLPASFIQFSYLVYLFGISTSLLSLLFYFSAVAEVAESGGETLSAGRSNHHHHASPSKSSSSTSFNFPSILSQTVHDSTG